MPQNETHRHKFGIYLLYISVKLPKCTFISNSLQFSAGINGKHQQLSFLFTQIMITEADYQLIKTYLCAVPCAVLWYDVKKIFIRISKLTFSYLLYFTSCMYGFSDLVNLLGSAPGTALHLWCGALGYEACETWVMILDKWAHGLAEWS